MPLELSDDLRQLVINRAGNRCEYCLLPQTAAFHKHEPDHIVPRQHGGETDENNLALACMRCNRYKGPNVGSIDPLTDKLVSFFNPRIHEWKDHFELKGAMIHPLTPEARVTVKIMRLNDEQRVIERMRLLDSGLME
jgi:5-methylcytosine-specific restriction endonuclease McrA